MTIEATTALTPEMLLNHWQGHRRLTRRAIEAFPEDELFSFTAGDMRAFGSMMVEVLNILEPTLHGVVNREWLWAEAENPPDNKDALLAAWDAADRQLAATWPQVTAERLLEEASAFGMFNGPVAEILLYLIDNEVHHRGQGYVYLRLLGVEPPAFYER